MNKLFNKIATGIVGIALAIGVGVAVGSGNKGVTKVKAETSSGSVSASKGALSGWTASGTGSAYSDGSVRFDSSGDNVYKTDVFTNSTVISNMTALSVSVQYKINGTAASANAVTIAPYVNGSYITGTTANGFSSTSKTTKTIEISSGLSGCTGFKLTYTKSSGNLALYSLSWTATYSASTSFTVTIAVNNSNYGGVDKNSVTSVTSGTSISASGNVLTVGSNTVTATPTTSTTQYTYAFGSWTGIPAGGTVTGNITVTANFTQTANPVSSLAITDSMTNTTYTQGDPWDPTGFTVNAYYSGSPSTPIDVTSQVSWSYSPDTTASTETTSVTVTASFGGKTATSSAQTVTITEKQYIGGIVDGEKYFIIAAWNGTEYYLNGFSSTDSGSALGLVWPGDDNVPTDDTDAWTFTKGFDDDVWRVTSEEYESQLYSVSENNGLRATDSPTDDDQWEIELYNSNIYMRNTKFNSQKGEYLTVYSTPDFRTYSSRSAQDAQGGTPSIIRFVHYVAPKTLNSLTVSGATSSFTAGDNFSLGNATITAVYSDESVVIPTNNSGLSFKLDGSTIATSDILTSADNGKSLVIRYTDAESRYADADGYTITVNPKAVQSVKLDKNSATITKSGTVDLTATVSDQYAIQTVKWLTSEPTIATLSSTTSTSGNSITVTGSSSNTGTSVITAYVDENNNNTLDSGEKSATCSVIVSADPVLNMYDESSSNVTSGSINKFTSSANFYLNVVAEGFQGTITYTWSSSNTSAVSIDEQVDEMCEFDVNGAGDARLSCHAVGATSGNLTVYVDVHVKEPAVSSVTWSASNIDVFTNVSLTSSTVSSWDAQYDLEDGSHGYLAFGQYDLYIGSTKVTSLPRQWLASDDGETMHIEYGGVSSSSVSVSVTQYINAITKKTSTDHNFSWAQTVSSPIAFSNSDTSITLGGVAWTKNSQSETFSVQGSGTRRYIQIGRSATANSITLRTSAISGTITRIAVDCAKGSNGTSTLTATVGGETFIPTTTMNSFTNNVGGIISEEGSASGEVVITMSASGTSGKQMYLHSIEIDYTTSSSETISNLSAHKNAQKAAVKFAKAFNTAMNGANVCSGTFENLSAGWSNASAAYTQFLSDISLLSSTEQDWAKDLLANATAQWGSDADEACVERAMKTYEFCVSHYKGTCNPFMSEVRPVKSIHISPYLNILGSNPNTAAIVIIVSVLSVAAVGGYFLFRKKKEQ